MAEPYPTPLKYVPDQKWGQGYIQSGLLVLAQMHDVDYFPCQEEHGADGGAIQMEIDATGNELVKRYNLFPDLLAACKSLISVIRDSAQEPDGTAIRWLGITSGQKEYESLDAARAAIAKAEGA